MTIRCTSLHRKITIFVFFPSSAVCSFFRSFVRSLDSSFLARFASFAAARQNRRLVRFDDPNCDAETVPGFRVGGAAGGGRGGLLRPLTAFKTLPRNCADAVKLPPAPASQLAPTFPSLSVVSPPLSLSLSTDGNLFQYLQQHDQLLVHMI